MSYEQVMKHNRNHRKNRFYQQCSGYFGKIDLPYPTYSEEKAKDIRAKSFQKILNATHDYPIFIAYDERYETFDIVPSNHIAGYRINSYDELLEYKKNYVD